MKGLLTGEYIGQWVRDRFWGDVAKVVGVIQEPQQGEWFVVVQVPDGSAWEMIAAEAFWDRYKPAKSFS